MDVSPKRIVMGLLVSPPHSLSNEAGQDALFEDRYDSDGQAPYFGDVELEKDLLEAYDEDCLLQMKMRRKQFQRQHQRIQQPTIQILS